MITVSDEDLVIAARSGNRQAFATLVQRYSAAAKAVAFHIQRDYHASEDAAQEAFITAYKTTGEHIIRRKSDVIDWPK